jgi:hypothetical protein
VASGAGQARRRPDGLTLLDAMDDEHRLIDPLLAAVDHALAADNGRGAE